MTKTVNLQPLVDLYLRYQDEIEREQVTLAEPEKGDETPTAERLEYFDSCEKLAAAISDCLRHSWIPAVSFPVRRGGNL